MLRHTRGFKITKVKPELLERFYKIMISINDLYTYTPLPVVQVSILKNQEEGISVEITTYGTNRDFIELCRTYEELFGTLEQIS